MMENARDTIVVTSDIPYTLVNDASVCMKKEACRGIPQRTISYSKVLRIFFSVNHEPVLSTVANLLNTL